MKAKTFCSKVLISKKYCFNINLLSKISHFFKKMKFSNFKALYIKFDASLKLENHVKRCVYVSIFKLFLFFQLLCKNQFLHEKKHFLLFFAQLFKNHRRSNLKMHTKKSLKFSTNSFPHHVKANILRFCIPKYCEAACHSSLTC